jgi:hypothetical protein
MRNETVAVIMVIVIVSAFLAGLGSSAILSKNGSATGTTTTSTTCVIPDEGQVLLQVMNSTSGRPIADAPVYAQFLSQGCSPNTYTVVDLSTTLTNATGFVTFSGEVGEFHLNLHTFGNYFVDVSTNPGETACVTLGIPNGTTNIAYSGFLESSCSPPPATMCGLFGCDISYTTVHSGQTP